MPFPARTDTMSLWFLDKNEQKSDFQLVQKTLRRIVLLFYLRQWSLKRTKILPQTKRILWIHSSSHIGDSLMRLSSVSLLCNFDVDLYAGESATTLFSSSELFRQVFKVGQDETLILKEHYDLIILDDLKSESIKRKKKLFPKTHFVTIHEFFDYCRDDFNFIFFSWHRMAYLLRDIQPYHDIESQAKLTISIPAGVRRCVEQLPINNTSIAVAVGGEDSRRTYQAWEKVVQKLHKHNSNRKIVLVGSRNGLTMRDRIITEIPSQNIIDCVGKYSLLETAAIIKECCLLICADGGLLHISNAVGTQSVCLFAGVKPEFRETHKKMSYTLYNENNVNYINSHEITKLAAAITVAATATATTTAAATTTTT